MFKIFFSFFFQFFLLCMLETQVVAAGLARLLPGPVQVKVFERLSISAPQESLFTLRTSLGKFFQATEGRHWISRYCPIKHPCRCLRSLLDSLLTLAKLHPWHLHSGLGLSPACLGHYGDAADTIF